ncbi:Interferon-activable protein [Heracleum sosnowskyi]|uniref:Interferon-activable protein n=1 Tax=Heracleum sosnowskyi TaxID=360622 RepID=A0AAD8NB55_9APIA|nr:Interferon-activable protein [Heracleum sosnowskyi]
MDVAVIDWKDSKFVRDDALENINAPQWVDFNAPSQPVDDDSWFCKPDCNHPKTVDDFLKKTPTLKLQRSASVSEMIPFGDRTRREAALKKRGLVPASSAKESKLDGLVEDKAKLKEAIKSSTEKKQFESISPKDEKQKLRSTLSARNLFAGRDLLNQISDFCSDLKKLALRAKERENVEKENPNKTPLAVNKQELKECSDSKLKIVLDERKPLLEVSKEKYEVFEKSNGKQKPRKIRNENAENAPIRLDLKYVGGKEENLSQIRTNPPSPQCFSAKRAVTNTATPTNFKPRTQERGILQELEHRKDVRKETVDNKVTPGRLVPLPAEREPAKTLDVFWFLKPCTLAS